MIENTILEDTIIVESIDNSFLYIDTEPTIARELSDFFSFFTPNYKFMPAYKNGRWDGKTRLYKILGSVLPTGLFNILTTFASERNYTVIDNRTQTTLKTPSDSEIEAFMANLKPYSNGKLIFHYDYQKEAIKKSLETNRATILSATSSGKSLIIYSLVRWYQKHLTNKILILVPTVNLVTQMYSDFGEYSEFDDTWNVEDNVYQIRQGKKKNQHDKQVYISTWQSVYKMPEEYFSQFDAVMCDEVHLASANSIIGIMEKSKEAFVRIGFTGTLKDMKLHQLTIVGLFGDIKQVTTARDLMDRGFITKLDIKFMILKYNQNICKEINRRVVERITSTGKKIYRKNYPVELDFITQCVARNMYICNLASVLPGNTLILFNKVAKHGKPLYKLLSSKIKNKKVYYISGETKAEEREAIRKAMEKEKDSILVASYGTLSTGVSITSLQFVIFASPYKSEIKVLQSIGRILRKKKGKNKAVLFDLVDDFRYKKQMNYSFKHFQRRYEIYKKEKFPISVSEFQLM
jgi:superfamily II DNA or RNA helicase